jgi:seryl-tRNA synthetase
MEKDQHIKETEKEIAELKAELIVCCKAIKDCKDSEERKRLFEEKKEIKADIEEVENELKTLNEVTEETPVTEPVIAPEPEPAEELKQVNKQ